ncbi:WcaI family glycosyltransferase [Chitinophaga barathri]|uniref:Colanic acid biosynthesis glycosyltransferase WcaI n=1 Tax=Chitinophaga barathri TaxID=1647451 RepID=A0A3N4MDY6_9BACT|nr:WcaI family glycosyltransferase [Chitinophaga barathri]RPD41798.1 colanic acid biosynthesis glycosyltransferase WcaI [Chitinophaga barathri]
MSKRVLLIGGNFSPEPTGIGKYNGEMIRWLVENGYECTVITSYPYYPQWEVQEPYGRSKRWYKKEVSHGGKLKVYRCPQYVPAQPTGKKRMLLDLSFSMSAFFKLLQIIPARKHDLVITVAPSFQLGLLAVLYKKLRGAQFLYHIQDLQIEAARDLQMIRSDRLIKMLFGVERYILRRADVVSSISDGMMHRIGEKVQKHVQFFPNWVDTSLFYPVDEKETLKQEYGFAPEDKVILYSGAIGEKQGLEAILHTAKAMLNRPDLKFVICGSGPYKSKLEAMAAEMSLQNIIFYPIQPFEKFNRFLNMADVHLVIQKAGASDLVMPSKLSTILAVGGLALVTANRGSGLHSLVDKYQMGILVNAEDQQALNEGVAQAVSESSAGITGNARAYAAEHLAISGVMGRFEEIVVNRNQQLC